MENRIEAVGLRAGLAVLGFSIAGCQGSNYAVSTLERSDNERATKLILTEAEQAEAIAAMKSVAVDHTPEFNRNRITHGMRWSDVPNAVIAACDEEGVEMVVVREEETPWGIRFHMRTVDDRPATLDVTQTHDERIYEAKATIGRFAAPRDEQRAERLIEELGRFMARYGEKRRLPE